MISLRCPAGLALLFSAAAVAGAAERVAVFGDALARSTDLAAELQRAGLELVPLDAAGLERLPAHEARLVIIAAGAPCPPSTRLALTRFLADHRHVMVVGAENFDYSPQPVRGVPAVDLADPAQYQVVQPPAPTAGARYAIELAQVSRATTPDGRSALSFRTTVRGMSDVAVRGAVASVSAPARTVVTFWARGDSYADLLAVKAVDTAGGEWIGFVPLTGEWRRHALSLADLLPRGWQETAQPPPQLDAARIATLSLGLEATTIWREKPMAFAVGGVDLAEDARAGFAPTSALAPLHLPFAEIRIGVPSGLFNPFHGARPLGGSPAPLVQVGTGALSGPVSSAWSCPPPEIPFPGVQMGTDTKKEFFTVPAREQRRIPLWRERTPAPGDDGVVAELRLLAGGPLAGSALALFGVAPADLARDAALRASLVQTAVRILRQPKIAAVTVNTTEHTALAPAAPSLRVQVHNPLDRAVPGRIRVSVAGGQIRGTAGIALPPRGVAEASVVLGAVPADFPFAAFDWEVTLETDAGRDVFTDTVDTERALLHALAHLARTQRAFPDGRISHHYFGDAYGVRGLFAYLDLVRRQPERLQRHRELWAANDVATLRACGLRFVDMLLARQTKDGAIPMGYGEHSFSYNVADGGQIALAIGQIAPLLDERRRAACGEFCRRFARWAETFYLDDARSAELRARTEKAKQNQARAGHYGLGSSRGVRNPLGPSWVLPDILGAQLLLANVDPAPEWRRIADRNIRAYLDAGYAATGYFHAEAFIWAWLDTRDAALRGRLANRLTQTFVPDLLEGRADDMFELGARRTLRALPLIYYRRYVADDPEVRAALLKCVWTFGSESSERSMHRLAEAHPKPHHGEALAASKYASFGAIWAAELLEAGSTLLRAPGLPPGAAPR